ncbi:ABC-type phosphate/phosphonate transport system substrate-binding protein [Desulfitispora alkaliphila]|uniref:hypothetical protein n=1 Tax=Desulfitispora alkaliphila TaxID=622674 RepID=UPI003D1A47CF
MERGVKMDLAQKLLKEFTDLPEEKKKKLIEFAIALKKEKVEVEKMMDTIIDENEEALEELSK